MARYIGRVKDRVWFVPTIASETLAPTVAEIGDGTLLSDPDSENGLVSLEGFTATATSVETPLYGAPQTPKIAGEIQLADSALIFYKDDSDNPIKTLLARGVEGFIVIGGPGTSVSTSTVVNVYPIEVSGNNDVNDAGNTAKTFRIDVAVNGIPGEELNVLAGGG